MTFQSVQGQCPACRGNSLFLAEGGYVTCSRIDCPNPDAVSTLLDPGSRADAAPRAPRPLAVGDVIHGGAYGVFSRDHYEGCRIVAVGPDWIDIGGDDGRRWGSAEGRRSLELLQQARDEPCPLDVCPLADKPRLTTA